MKLSQWITGSIIILLILGACQPKENPSEEGIRLTGTVEYPRDGLVLLEKYGDQDITVFDTLQIEANGNFSQIIDITATGFYRLNFYDIQMVDLLLGQEDLQIKLGGNDPNGRVEVSGSQDMVYFQDLVALTTEFQQKQTALNGQYVQAAQSGDQATSEALKGQFIDLAADHRNALRSKIRSMGNSLAVLQVINQLDAEQDYDLLDSLGRVFEANPPDESYTQKLLAYVDQVRQERKLNEHIAIGRMAPDIALPNPQGDTVRLSSLRGKIVLLDFWAQWCKPCRMENPNIVNVYNKYKDQGFEVFGVSLDRQKDKWLQGIDEDGLKWTQVSDLKYWQSAAAQTYRVSAIPASFLLDQEGRIIAKNLRGPALEKKVAEILG